MPFLKVALTSRISATMTVVGSSKFSHCADGNSKRRIRFSWSKKFCNSNSGVFLGREHVDLQVGHTGEEMLRNCTYGKKARLTRTKDAFRLSSAVCLTKWRPIIRSPPSRRLTLPHCVIGPSSFMTDWMALFGTPKRVAKQAKTLLCIVGFASSGGSKRVVRICLYFAWVTSNGWMTEPTRIMNKFSAFLFVGI